MRAQRDRVIIKTKAHVLKGSTACTADLSATTSTVNLPANIDLASAITVKIDGRSVAVGPR